ncbi:signal transduction histidine kinase [Pedobacter sp. UYP24]
MKLQFKLAFYNTLTKLGIVSLLGIVILISINRISTRHIQQRLLQKKDKLISNLSTVEINDLLTKQRTYTDYSLVREEYIILTQSNQITDLGKNRFLEQPRIIENDEANYQILLTNFSFRGKTYKLELGENMYSVLQLERTISVFTFIIMVIAIILSLVADLAFTRFLLAPFYKIIEQKLNKVDDPMNFNYNAIKTSTEDFTVLDHSISTLMSRMANLLTTEKEFIANVSHELLTPIATLSSRFENLLDGEKLSDEGQNKIFSSLKTLSRLKSIINSLLLISKVENNQFKKQDSISIRKTLNDVYEELEHRLLMKNLKFTINLVEDHIIKGNQSLIHTLFMNVINNAIKYNVEQGTIEIKGSVLNNTFQLAVIDTGIGMNEEKSKNVFKRFERLHSTEKDSYGLGLSIVQSILVFHGIDLRIESEKNKGTKLIFSFYD